MRFDKEYQLTLKTDEIKDLIESACQSIMEEAGNQDSQFDESAHIKGTFWTDGKLVKVNGEEVYTVCRVQLDAKNHHKVIIIDSYGKDPKAINNDRPYVYRIYLTLED